MNARQISTETNDLVRQLINLANTLPFNSQSELAKKGLLDASTLLAGTLESLNYESSDSNAVAKINQATDAAGKSIFWIDYLSKESLIDNSKSGKLQNVLGYITSELITLRNERQKNITPVFQGEWLLED